MNLSRARTTPGDNGETLTAGGEALSKTSALLEIIGDLDYLNASFGEIRYLFVAYDARIILALQELIVDFETRITNTEKRGSSNMDDILIGLDKEINRLYNAIPNMKDFNLNQNFEKNFILPGTNLLEAKILQARALCRKLEREMWKLHAFSKLDPPLLKFINRLADYLYVLARFAVHIEYKKPAKYRIGDTEKGSYLIALGRETPQGYAKIYEDTPRVSPAGTPKSGRSSGTGKSPTYARTTRSADRKDSVGGGYYSDSGARDLSTIGFGLRSPGGTLRSNGDTNLFRDTVSSSQRTREDPPKAPTASILKRPSTINTRTPTNKTKVPPFLAESIEPKPVRK